MAPAIRLLLVAAVIGRVSHRGFTARHLHIEMGRGYGAVHSERSAHHRQRAGQAGR